LQGRVPPREEPGDGKVIGGIGVSGVAGDQDGVVAKAGADALK